VLTCICRPPACRPNHFPACRGKRQSPVLLPATGAAAKALGQPDAKSTFSYGVLSNPKVVNNGHTLQVSLPADFVSSVKIPIKGKGHRHCTLFQQGPCAYGKSST
jgi:carbonic anhydrase